MPWYITSLDIICSIMLREKFSMLGVKEAGGVRS